jgi:hypothetical protein
MLSLNTIQIFLQKIWLWGFLGSKWTVLKKFKNSYQGDRLCGLVVRGLGYRSGGPGSIPGTIRKKSSEFVTGPTQSREYN